MKKDKKQKKLLILGGANVHVKVVKAAHEMGIETIVVDYLDPIDSPAKLESDFNYKIDIFNEEHEIFLRNKIFVL